MSEIGNLLVSSLHLTSDDAVAKTVVVLIIFITLHNKHLKKRHLFSKAGVKVFEGLTDGSRGDNGLGWTTVASATGITSEVLEVDSRRTNFFTVSSAASASTTAGRSAASACSHLVLAKIGLHVTSDHLVEH